MATDNLVTPLLLGHCVNWMWIHKKGEIQQLKSDNNLIETKKELQIEQYKSQIADLKQVHLEDKHEYDSVIKQCQNELNTLRSQNQDMSMEQREQSTKDQSMIARLQRELQSKNEDFDTLKSQVREQMEGLKVNMNAVEKEHESKMMMKQNEHDQLMQECQERMKTVLDKKNAQNKRLKRLLEKTVTEYEKEKQQTQTMLNLRNEQLKELTNDLQIWSSLGSVRSVPSFWMNEKEWMALFKLNMKFTDEFRERSAAKIIIINSNRLLLLVNNFLHFLVCQVCESCQLSASFHGR